MIQLKNPRFLILIIIGTVLIAVSLIYLVQFNIPEEHVPQPKKIGPSTTSTTLLPTISESIEGQVAKITVEGNEFRFIPAAIKVARGSKVGITFKNIGKIPHNYVIDELNVRTNVIGSGEAETIVLTMPNSAGIITYSSYCSVPGHRELGMEGTIVIE